VNGSCLQMTQDKGIMRMRVVLLLAMIFFLKNPASAEAGVGEKLAGVTIKTTVKICTAMTNIEKTKKKIIDKLQKTDDTRAFGLLDRYAIQYAKSHQER